MIDHRVMADWRIKFRQAVQDLSMETRYLGWLLEHDITAGCEWRIEEQDNLVKRFEKELDNIRKERPISER